MAIYTRRGTPVTINSACQDKESRIWLTITMQDGRERQWGSWGFHADGGGSEIVAAIERVGLYREIASPSS